MKRRRLRSRGRGRLGAGAIAALVGGAACGPSTPVEHPPAAARPRPAPSVTSEAPPAVTESQPAPSATAEVTPAPDPTPSLRPFAVLHETAPTRELYSWTTVDQVRALEKDPTLLSRTESPAYGSSFFDAVMGGRAEEGDRIAKLIHTKAFARARFAWPHAWPTLMGWQQEVYGDQLIRVLLKAGALIATLHDGSKTWRITDTDGHDRPESDLLQHPELLAAVYFVHDVQALAAAPGATKRPRGSSRLHYREFVLVNESQIELYEVGTETTVAEIDRGVAAIEVMLAWILQKEKLPLDISAFNAAASQIVWPGRAAPDKMPLDAYAAALAFPNEVYLPSADNLRALLSKLREVRRGSPGIRHRPTVRFQAAQALVPIPKPPEPKPRWRGTFGGSF